MEYILKDELDSAFDHDYRHYLTGHLTRPQPYLKHFDDDIEIGMSFYQDFTVDHPHVHPIATEHGYVLEGAVKLLYLNGEREEKEFKKGDFFLIRPGVPHVSKNQAGTRVLFIKSPSINDKTVVELDETARKWILSW